MDSDFKFALITTVAVFSGLAFFGSLVLMAWNEKQVKEVKK